MERDPPERELLQKRKPAPKVKCVIKIHTRAQGEGMKG